ncbi:MAG: DUF3368 domain-containing protein [Saprospiraceae bacterium]|jgi:predicted nucleic acid-binding protein|nr:DUF3368 domain-containing protein [Saprospiraceae bacterium]
MIVVSDTSAISNLFAVGKLELLRDLFDSIVMPIGVMRELAKLEDFGYDISKIGTASWIIVQHARDTATVFNLARHLDSGESEAIVLAQELNADYLLIDERRGWKIANSLGIKTMGVLGVLLKAKSEGLIPTISTILHDLETTAGFWVSDALRKEVFALAGE